MSNDLAIIKELGIEIPNLNDKLEAQRGLVRNPNALYPKIRMLKDTKGFQISLGDQVLDTCSNLLFLVLGDENFYGSRALFAPGNDSTTPVCATRLSDPRQKWTGRWLSENFKSPSGSELVECRRCPWSKFDSEPLWDKSKSGRGQACKERRVIFGIRVVPTNDGRQNRFTLSDETVYRLILPATSIRSAEGIAASASAAGVPLGAAIINLTNKIENKGSIKWSVLEASIVGFIGDKNSYDRVQEFAENVHELITSIDEIDVEPYIETSATSKNTDPAQPGPVTDEEIPF